MCAEQARHSGLTSTQFGQRVVDVRLGLGGSHGHRSPGGEHLDALERIGERLPAPEQFGRAAVGLELA